MGEYLDSDKAWNIFQGALKQNVTEDLNLESTSPSTAPNDNPDNQRIPHVATPKTQHIRARTARRWLRWMGFHYKEIRTKGVYVDGHEQPNVFQYRHEVFVPRWQSLMRRFVIFNEDGTYSLPEGLQPGDKPIVPVAHDEFCFNANDGRRRMWMEGEKQPLGKKERGEGIMVSGFITPRGIVELPDTPEYSEIELLKDPTWPRDDAGKPIRQALRFIEYGKGNWWTGERMAAQVIHGVIPIFNRTFPRCEALFCFDYATNHSIYAKDALKYKATNWKPGNKQPVTRDGFIYSKNRVQPMQFADGRPKGAKQVLIERGLYSHHLNGKVLRLQCPETHGRTGCDPTIQPGCCARVNLSRERDFMEQEGLIAEEVKARNHLAVFFPKFHCEINPIERFWCSGKYFARENCGYNIESPMAVVPQALNSVSTATIVRYFNHCQGIIDTYEAGVKYGTKEFGERVYKGHRQVQDKSK